MLLLTRMKGQNVRVYNPKTGEILGTVQVISIKGERVRIGFSFKQALAVDREEVYDDKLHNGQIPTPSNHMS